MESNEIMLLKEEVAQMRSDISRLLEQISKKETPPKKVKETPMPINPKVSKVEAAAILLISPRQLQRVRKRLNLKWRMEGRDSYYYLDTIVKAIHTFGLSWSQSEFDKIVSRLNRLPQMPTV